MDVNDLFSSRFCHSEDELVIIKKKVNDDVVSKGYLPINDGYNSSLECSMEDVESNPHVFIMEECLPACKELWSKNIYTFMVSDYNNDGKCWIEMKLDCLSDENVEIFNNLCGEDVFKFSYHKGCVNFGVNCVGKTAQMKLLELAKQFKMQDVPAEDSFMSLEAYLVKCECYDEVENPNYYYMEDPLISGLFNSIDDLEKYEEYLKSDNSKKTLKKYNPAKVTKPLNEYFEGTSYILDEGRVYYSDYHYQKHLKYVDYLNKQQGKSEDSDVIKLNYLKEGTN